MDSLGTRAVYIEIPMLSWNLPNDPKHRGFLTNTVGSEGDQLLAGAFHAIKNKTELDMLQIAKKRNWNQSSYIKDTFLERFQQKIPTLHQSTCTFKVGFSSMGKYKDEVPDMSGSNQSVETSCKNKLKLKELKDFCFKSKEKLATEKWMYETAIPKFWNFSGGNIISDYEFLFPILNAFTDGMEDYYARCYKANDANGLQKPFAWLQFHFIIRDCISSKLAHYRVWLKGTQITITC